MLVLSRFEDEEIMIGTDIVVQVISVRGGKVRLGITAPSHIAVHRKEVYDAMQQSDTGVRSLAKESGDAGLRDIP